MIPTNIEMCSIIILVLCLEKGKTFQYIANLSLKKWYYFLKMHVKKEKHENEEYYDYVLNTITML